MLTAGVPRKPGMSRDDLVKTNVAIVRSVSEQIAAHAPGSIVIVVSNPLDAMVYTAWKVTGFPTNRIVGQAGCLDMARFEAFIAEETGFSVEDINTLLLGGHGDDMVPLPRFTNIAGIPVTEFMSAERLDELVERAKQGGGEIVALLGTSAYYAPAAAVTQMVEAIVRDKKRILPCAGYCDGQYGIDGLFVGVPCVLGASGMERILEVHLEPGEQDLLTASAGHVREPGGGRAAPVPRNSPEHGRARRTRGNGRRTRDDDQAAHGSGRRARGNDPRVAPRDRLHGRGRGGRRPPVGRADAALAGQLPHRRRTDAAASGARVRDTQAGRRPGQPRAGPARRAAAER